MLSFQKKMPRQEAGEKQAEEKEAFLRLSKSNYNFAYGFNYFLRFSNNGLGSRAV
jgi:hypothetical protein